MGVPDNASVWRPPAATLAIRTPVSRVTRHGRAERVSSLDDLFSGSTLAEDSLLRLLFFSPHPVSNSETTPPILEPCNLGLTATEKPEIQIQMNLKLKKIVNSYYKFSHRQENY